MGEIDLVWGLLLVLADFLISSFLTLVLLVCVGWNPLVSRTNDEAGMVAALVVGAVAVWGLLRWVKKS